MMTTTLRWEDEVGEPLGTTPIEVRPARQLSLPDLYRSQWEPMVRVAAALTGDRAAAEDVVQDAFVAVGRKIDTLTGSEVAYLRRSVVNGCRSSMRRGRAVKRQPIAPATEGAEVAGADVAAGERAQHERVLAALDALSERQRQCLVLRYYAGLSDAEVAHAVGIGAGSAKTHIRRGLDALRTSLEDLR
jgi:RNA polymerase sigma factor (sigma-70 family)